MAVIDQPFKPFDYFPGKDLLDTLLDIPTVLSPVALGTALLLFFGSGPGRIFEEHGIRFTFVVSGIILAQFSVVVGLAVRSLKAGQLAPG